MKAKEKALATEEKAKEKQAKEDARRVKEAAKAEADAARERERARRDEERTKRAAEREARRRDAEEIRHDAYMFRNKMKAIRERERAEKTAAKEREKIAQAEADAIAEADHAAAAAKLKTSVAVQKTLSSAYKVGSGAATLLAAGSGDVQRMLTVLAALQGIGSELKGINGLWKNAKILVNQYRGAVVAATAAEVTLGAVQKANLATKTAEAAAAGASGAATATTGGIVAGAGGGLFARTLAPVVGTLTAGTKAAIGGLGAALTGLPGAITAAIVGPLAAIGMAANVGGVRDKSAAFIGRNIDMAPGTWGFWGAKWGSKAILNTDMGLEKEEKKSKDLDKVTALRERARAEAKIRAEFYEEMIQGRAEADAQRGQATREARTRGINADLVRRGYVPGKSPEYASAVGDRSDARYAADAARRAVLEAKFASDPANAAANAKRDLLEAQRKQQEAAAKAKDAWRQMDLGAERMKRELAAAREDAAAARRAMEAADAGVEEGKRKSFSIDEMAKARSESDQARAKYLDAVNREKTAVEELNRTQKEVSQEKVRAADASLQKTQQEVASRREMLEQEKQRYLSAKEKFGQKDLGEQRYLIDLAKRFQKDRGGLGAEELRALGEVATTDMTGEISQEFIKRAAGYDEAFGRSSQERMRRLEGEAKALELKLTDEREFKVTLESDSDAIAQRLIPQIQRLLDRSQADVERMVERSLQRRDDAATERRDSSMAGLHRQ